MPWLQTSNALESSGLSALRQPILGRLLWTWPPGAVVQGCTEHAVESRVDVVAGIVFEKDGEGGLGMGPGWGQAGRHELGGGDVADLGEEVNEGGALLRVARDEGVGSGAVDGMA